MTEPDIKALRILKKTYWSSLGWKKFPEVTPADLAYAKSARVMFDPVMLDHDQAVGWVVKIRNQSSQSDITNAFLASLHSRRVDWRSALGSYAFARHFPDHVFQAPPGEHLCAICGHTPGVKTEDLSILSFERHMWGGVRHSQPVFAAFDLERLKTSAIPQPKPQDYVLFKKILTIADSMKSDSRVTVLEKAIAPLIKSNAAERRILIEILGFAGILSPAGKMDYFYQFPNHIEREWPPTSKNDWKYPVAWWRGSDGVSWEAVDFWFPELRS